MAALRSLVSCAAVAAVACVGDVGRHREAALLQTWGAALDGGAGKAKDTPVTRVVKLLEQMSETLKKEMDEDAAMYDKLACWCNNNKYEKTEAISEAEAKIADLNSTIDAQTAKVSELKTTISQLEADVESGKTALADALALREKEAKEFHGSELESIQNIESLKAAVEVLSKHHGAALPQMALSLPTASFLSLRGRGRRSRDGPWDGDHESRLAQAFDNFLEQNGFTGGATTFSQDKPAQAPLLQKQADQAPPASEPADAWTVSDKSTIQRALRTASAFMQSHSAEEYYPSYSAQSGEIFGLLKELKSQMESDLSAAQKAELDKKATYEELRSSKQAEVEAASKQAESKEDELANTQNSLAEAKEDMAQTEAALTEDQKFAMNLDKTCEDADANFEQRKNARMAEIQAVSETISILQSDEARDTMSRTYSLLQVSRSSRKSNQRNVDAAKVLKQAAAKIGAPQLSVLASTVELDSFDRVKKAIDDMIKMLKVQQEDEVKKRDWCNGEMHSNEMETTKTSVRKEDLQTKIDSLSENMKKMDEEKIAASEQISQLQLEMQRASENRLKENQDFQATIADQRATQAVLKMALERMAKFYDEQDLLQTRQKESGRRQGQTPPVPQAEYTPSAGGGGVMQLLEKLIQDAKVLEADSQKSEASAQAQYEQLIGNTNAAVKSLQAEVMSKTRFKAEANKDKLQADADLVATVDELAGLGKYGSQLQAECDYLLKNFDTRQAARGQEVEALQQAKQILSGAASS